MKHPTEIPHSFQRKIARLIINGRFQRAAREVARYNSGKAEKVSLFLDRYEQLKWAEKVLNVTPELAVNKEAPNFLVQSERAKELIPEGDSEVHIEIPRKKLTVKLIQRNENIT